MHNFVGFAVLAFLCALAAAVLVGMPLAFSKGMRVECTYGKYYAPSRC